MTRTASLLRTVDDKLSLVLLNEYWDESMVLLKRRMCWSLEDVLYRPLKAPTVPLKASKRTPASVGSDVLSKLSADTKTSLKQLLQLDYALYHHYNTTFWQHIANEGPGFYAEVRELRSRVARLSSDCGSVRPVPAAVRVSPIATPPRTTPPHAGNFSEESVGGEGVPTASNVSLHDVGGGVARAASVRATVAQQRCTQLDWENVRFGCELGKKHGWLPPEQPCQNCVYDCKGKDAAT